jgi:hypothetical protein
MHLPIRVALVGLAPLVRDVLHNLITGESDMHVAAVIESVDELPGAPVDVYLLGVGASDGRTSERLLGRAPPPYRVIGVSADGRQMHLSELRPVTASLGSLSSHELLDVIRGGHRHAAGSADPSFNRGV